MEMLRYDALIPKISPCSVSLLFVDKIVFSNGSGNELVMPSKADKNTKIVNTGNNGIKKKMIARVAIAAARIFARLNRFVNGSTAKTWVKTPTTPIRVNTIANICGV